MKIVVLTCDKNTWVLPIFQHFLEKFWPDCPWPLEIVGGPGLVELVRPFYDGKASLVSVSHDNVWSDMLIAYLMGYHSERDLILLLFEDYVISGRIDSKAITACHNVIKADTRIRFLRLNPCPGPELPWIPALDLGEFAKATASYLTSTQPTIWHIGHLLRLLKPGESAWGFEIQGSERARTLPGAYLGSHKTLIPVINYLRRGRIDPAARQEMIDKW